MNLVVLYCNQAEEKPEERCARINNNRINDWKRRGDHLRIRRESLGLSRAFISWETSVNVSRLRRLELGQPIKDENIIYRIYELVLEKYTNTH